MTISTYGSIDPSALASLQRTVDAGYIASADYRDTTDSTNTCAIDDLRSGHLIDELLPRLYLADTQTAGRGRHGRIWSSETGSLTFSLLVAHHSQTESGKTCLSASLLPIAAGVAIARAIEFCCAPLRASLKWPNDVYVDGGKVAGILLETTQAIPDRFVIGVGINVNACPNLPYQSHHAEMAHSQIQPKSLAESVGRYIDRYDFLESVVEQLTTTTRESVAEIVSEFRKRCWLTHQTICFQTDNAQQTGTCLGITEHGALRIRTEDGEHCCSSGEVHRLRVH